jgi:hypothetical protein
MRQISVVTGLPPSKNGQTTVIEDEQVVSNFPKFLANKVNHIFVLNACMSKLLVSARNYRKRQLRCITGEKYSVARIVKRKAHGSVEMSLGLHFNMFS